MKRLVVCCDGTWNRPDKEGGPTNVAKFALGVADADDGGTGQLVYYHRGVGTDPFEHIAGGAFGYGLSRNVRDAYRFLVAHYEPGDELYFLGFSRGAFTARSAVGFVRNAGILRPEHAGRVDEAYELYRDRDPVRRPDGIEARLFRRTYSYAEVPIHFVGVWDTVGSLGIPGLKISPARRWWGFHDTALSASVAHAYHALAIDERRKPFAPTLWQKQAHATDQVLEQVWFTGVHSDVGGGYEEPALAEIALLWMVGRARGCGLAFKPDHFVPAAGPVAADRRELGLEVAPDARGELHDSRKGLFAVVPAQSRTLASNDDPGLTAASTARRRYDEDPGYRPDNLRTFLDGGGQVTDVGSRA